MSDASRVRLSYAAAQRGHASRVPRLGLAKVLQLAQLTAALKKGGMGGGIIHSMAKGPRDYQFYGQSDEGKGEIRERRKDRETERS